ncbi:MAG: family 78 glycoside hydrolase catalytic domain [Clostridiales bacterium]|nr:family 78 glycoside hydrolase catalytic domain [Clostridiales bacterium]
MDNKKPLSAAVWIAPDRLSASPVIIRRFVCRDIKNAELIVTGLGYFEARINGNKVSEDYYQPVVSDYEPRKFTKIEYPCHDSFTHRIYYCRYDIAHLLQVGENTLEIQLGGGWYVQDERVAEGEMSFGDRPKCIFELKLDDDIIPSDGSELWHDSEIRYSNLFIGEVHDSTADISELRRVICLPAPESELCEQIGVPDRVIRTINPTLHCEAGGRRIYDVGKNISGIVRIYSREGYTGRVTLRFAENLNADDSLNFDSCGGGHVGRSGGRQIMSDTFVCDGVARSFEAKFVWHAFRYFDVEGEFDRAEVLVIHSDVKLTAEFESDSEGLNFLFDSYIRTQLNNMHGSIPSDCPHRERLGYTGDGQICAPTAMLMFDSREFYRKWIRDILDCQDIVSGHIQHTAPFQGGGGGPGGWGCAVVLVPYYYWRQYGDVSILSECWEAMVRFISYLESRIEGGLIVREEEGGWCLGDWCTLEKCRLPEPFVNTFYFIKALRMMIEIAAELGVSSERFVQLENASLEAICANYFDPERGGYLDGTQGADAYAAELGLVNMDGCAEYYQKLGHFDTGFLGTDILCEQLFTHGFGDTVYELFAGEERGSFLYMKRRGATTIWEHWTGGSHDHPMFGACARQLFCGILGIRQPDGCAGWKAAVISPCIPDMLGRVSGSILTPRGRIAVSVLKVSGRIEFNIVVPDDINAEFSYKDVNVKLHVGENKITL